MSVSAQLRSGAHPAPVTSSAAASQHGGAAIPDVMSTPRFDHLRALEAESIHIMREVVAEFERPVMLYSIGKDSSVLLRLAQKAFYPGPIPFPLLHIDTTYKFREMIEFRDWYARGDRRAADRAHQPGSDRRRHAAVRPRHAALLRPAQDQVAARRRSQAGGFDAAFGGARRDEEKSRAKERVFSLRNAKGQWDPKRQRPELWHLLNSRIAPGRKHPRVPALELDRARRLALHPRREHPGRAALFRQGARGHRPRQLADRAGAVVRAAAAGREAADGDVPHALARMLALHRRRPLRPPTPSRRSSRS